MAAAYGLGHSEEVVGKAIKGIRNNIFIATKCGLVPHGKGDVYRKSRPESIRGEVEDSLRRLKVNEIDRYQIHWPDSTVDYEDSWATMIRLKEEGKVLFIGVCNYEVAMLQRCEATAAVQSLQPPYSILTAVNLAPADGLMRWTPNHHGKHEIAVGVDPHRFFDHFLRIVKGP